MKVHETCLVRDRSSDEFVKMEFRIENRIAVFGEWENKQIQKPKWIKFEFDIANTLV